MIRKTCLWLAAAGLLTTAAWAQSVDEIVEKHVQALGGKDKIKAVQTVRMSGKLMMGQGMEAPFTLELARPNKMRNEFTIQGMTGIQAFNGTTGWLVMPFMGKKDPEEMPADQVEVMKDQADIDGPLVDYKDKGYQVESLGKADLEGSPVHKLKVTKKNGDALTIYLDAETYLELRRDNKTKLQGQEIQGETTFGDYKPVGGMMMAHSMEMKQAGAPAGMSMTFDKIEVNPTIDPARFDMPKVEKPAAAPAAPPPPQQ